MMPYPESVADWWKKQIAEYEQDGMRDAEKGTYRPPYPGTDDPSDEEMNLVYKRGFMKRRKELGDKFEWK